MAKKLRLLSAGSNDGGRLGNPLGLLVRTVANERPHRALNRETPHQWYHRTLKARPNLKNITRDREFRIRHDRIDNDGKVTLRHEGKLRHLGVRKIHRRKKVVMLIDTEEVTVMDVETSEVLSRHSIAPGKRYWPDKQNSPGRWPGESDNNL